VDKIRGNSLQSGQEKSKEKRPKKIAKFGDLACTRISLMVALGKENRFIFEIMFL